MQKRPQFRIGGSLWPSGALLAHLLQGLALPERAGVAGKRWIELGAVSFSKRLRHSLFSAKKKQLGAVYGARL